MSSQSLRVFALVGLAGAGLAVAGLGCADDRRRGRFGDDNSRSLAAPSGQVAVPVDNAAPGAAAAPNAGVPDAASAPGLPDPVQLPPGVKRKHVVILSIDGMRPDALEPAHAQNLLLFSNNGARATMAFTIPLSLTLPSHSSMLSGYDMEHHGVSWNAAEPEHGFIKVPTVFSIAHAAGMRTVMIMGKGKFLTLELPDTIDEVHEVGFDDDGIAEMANYVGHKANFDLMFVHLPNPDLTGHAQGWMSPGYLDKVTHADLLFGRLIAALPADAVVIVTADHGGHDYGHGADVPIDRQIPWMIRGPGIKHGFVVTRPITTMDTAATALKLLGLQLGADAQGQPVNEAFESQP
jgi:hypothetical protein